MREQNGLQTPRIADRRSFVVYDGGTGEIVHRHDLLVLEGAEAPRDEDLEATMLESARSGRAAAGRLAVLALGDRKLERNGRYAVDLSTGSLIETGGDRAGAAEDRGGGVVVMPDEGTDERGGS